MPILDFDNQFTEKQRLATAAADHRRFTLFGGARGPGKSYWLRWYAIRALTIWHEQGIDGVRVMLACEDYPALRDRQIEKIRREFPPWLGDYAISVSEFQLHAGFGSGVVCLRNLDDPSKYQSSEYALIAVDELTKNPQPTFDILRGSLRWPGIDRTQFIAATNPTGLGAMWVRDLWITRTFPPNLEPIRDQFAFVPGLARDNPHLPESYWQELQTLSGPLKAAWADGDWFAGVEGLVYQEFTTANLTDDEPDPNLPIEIGTDDGFIDPRATLFIQRQPTRVLVFDELYQTKTLAERSVADVVERCKLRGWPLPQLAVGSPEAKELQARYRMADIPFRFVVHQVVQGVEAVRSLICNAQGHRALQVNRRCVNLIREIQEGYVYPEGKRALHEKPLDGNDHACDGLRYWVYAQPQVIQGALMV